LSSQRHRHLALLALLAAVATALLSLSCAWGNLTLTRGCPADAALPLWWLYALCPALTLLCFVLPISLWWRGAALDRIVVALALGVMISMAAWVCWIPIVNTIC